MRSLAVLEGLPTTIFITRAGKVMSVHTGQYDSQGPLDQAISNYTRGGRTADQAAIRTVRVNMSGIDRREDRCG